MNTFICCRKAALLVDYIAAQPRRHERIFERLCRRCALTRTLPPGMNRARWEVTLMVGAKARASSLIGEPQLPQTGVERRLAQRLIVWIAVARLEPPMCGNAGDRGIELPGCR